MLLRGKSATGKSDLAVRLMDQGWQLVADDYTELYAHDGVLYARPPKTLKGLIEVRGLGLIKVDHLDQSPVVAVFDLLSVGPLGSLGSLGSLDSLGSLGSLGSMDIPERLPALSRQSFEGLDVPRYSLQALQASAPAIIRLALKAQAQSLFYSLEA